MPEEARVRDLCRIRTVGRTRVHGVDKMKGIAVEGVALAAPAHVDVAHKMQLRSVHAMGAVLARVQEVLLRGERRERTKGASVMEKEPLESWYLCRDAWAVPPGQRLRPPPYLPGRTVWAMLPRALHAAPSGQRCRKRAR